MKVVTAVIFAVSAAIAIPTLGWISSARITDDIAETNQRKIPSRTSGSKFAVRRAPA